MDAEAVTAAARVTMSNVAIVLKRPKYPGNIGSAARCARNMGVNTLIVVDPPEIDDAEMKRTATHAASDLVGSIQWAPSLGEALAPFTYVVGTSARIGGSNLRRSMVSSRELAESLVDVSRTNRIALVFGPEDRGLTNEDLQLCNMIVTIPVSPAFRSINLSHAVMIICYELFSYRDSRMEVLAPPPRFATSAEIEEMYRSLKELLLSIDFIRDDNPDYWMVAIRNLLSRTRLYSRDVKIIRGFCRQIELYSRGRTSGSRPNKDLDIQRG